MAMERNNKLNLLGQFLLFLATLAWGSSFLILKNTIEEVPGIFVVGIRFFSASILLGLIFFKRIKNLDRETVKSGIVLGLIIACAYFTQTIGLKYTTPSRNAFVTAVYSIICPFLIWIMFRKKPNFVHVIGAFISIIGIGLIALSHHEDGSSLQLLGDGLTLISAIFYALQIIYTDIYAKKKDVISLLTLEFFVAGVILLLYAFTFEGLTEGYDKFILKGDNLVSVIYLTLICTLFAQFAQMIGQKYVSPTHSAIILSLESVFGALFSVIIGNEKLNGMLIIGFGLVFTAILFTELISLKKKKE